MRLVGIGLSLAYGARCGAAFFARLVLQPGFIAGSSFPMAFPGALLVAATPV
jgi:hypothetical protein